MEIDLYELKYRNYKNFSNNEKNNPLEITGISLDTIRIVKEQLNILKKTEPDKLNIMKFSDVTYTKFPIFDENKNYMQFRYTPVFIKEKKNTNPAEHMERFKNLDINNLPLIDVARFLNIKIEKSNNIEYYGEYMRIENKIVLGTDDIPTFIHELVHAIHNFLSNEGYEMFFLYDSENDLYTYDSDYNEFIAEFASLILCKMYNIENNASYSRYYIEMYNEIENGIPKYVIDRVEMICEFVKLCKEKM